MAKNKLYRSEKDKMVAGICGGIGEVYDIDPTLVRLLVAAGILFTGGTAILVYLLGWLIIPHESEV